MREHQNNEGKGMSSLLVIAATVAPCRQREMTTVNILETSQTFKAVKLTRVPRELFRVFSLRIGTSRDTRVHTVYVCRRISVFIPDKNEIFRRLLKYVIEFQSPPNYSIFPCLCESHPREYQCVSASISVLVSVLVQREQPGCCIEWAGQRTQDADTWAAIHHAGL